MLPRSRNYYFSGSSDFICSTGSWWDLTGNSNYKGKNVSSSTGKISNSKFLVIKTDSNIMYM